MSFARRLRLLLLGSGMCLLLASLPLVAQSVQHQRLQVRDPTHLYRTNKPKQGLSLYVLASSSPAPAGILLLLPGFGGAAKKVFQETSLGQEAARAGLVTVVPTLNNRLYLDSASNEFLDQVLRQIGQQYPTASRNLVIGGFSAGGHLALAYAEGLLRDTTRLPVRVKAVFGVDPPVDMAAFWQTGQRRIAQACSPLLVREGQSMVATLTHAFGGSPEQVPAAYRQYSAYSSSSPTGGNLSLLATTPVRVYCEPDLPFWRQHYCTTMQLEDLNTPLLQSMIDCLHRQGNTRAYYVETKGKGRVGKRPFPHSWSIVDAPECIRWLQVCIRE